MRLLEKRLTQPSPISKIYTAHELVWVLDLASRTVTVHRTGVAPQPLGTGDTLSCEDVLPGFSLPLHRLFREVAKS